MAATLHLVTANLLVQRSFACEAWIRNEPVRGQAHTDSDDVARGLVGSLSAFVSELLHSLVELFILNRLLDHCDGTVRQDSAKNLAVWIAGDHHDG